MAGLPKDLLPKSTAHFCFQLWDSDGTLDRIHERLMSRSARRLGERRARMTRSSTPRAPRRPKRGSSVAPQASMRQEGHGRERHILVDTLGLLLGVSVLPANIQDRDGAAICCSERGGAFLSSNVFSRTRAENGKDCRRDRLVAPRNCQAI